MKNKNVDVTQCDDGSFCCGIGNNGSTCCSQGKGVWMVDGKETSVNPNKTSSAAASSSVTPATSAASASVPSKYGTATHHSRAGAIAGGVVGGAVALLLLAGLVYWVMRRRRHGNAADRYSRTELDMGQEKRFRTEMPAAERPHEADSAPRMELDGGARQERKQKRGHSLKELAG